MVVGRGGAATVVGVVLGSNEDCWWVGGWRWVCKGDGWGGAEGLFVVAGGMGGHAAGEVASALAVEGLKELAQGVVRPEDVRSGVAAASDRIMRAAGESVGRGGMGTTVAGLGLVEVAGVEHWVVFNVGD